MTKRTINTIKYPDGQISVHESSLPQREYFCRVNSYEDLFILKGLSDIYKHNGWEMPCVTIPCMFGQRSDRRFHNFESFDLKIICDFINSCDFKSVTVIDPHSDVVTALLNNCKPVSSFGYVQKVVEALNLPDLVLVSPDAGAYKKVFKYAVELNLELVAANKFRDRQGVISLNILGDVKNKPCLIVDDLLDGGYTFFVLAEKLREQQADKVFLYITHGYFHKGFDLLKTSIDHIFCTNSVKEINTPYVTYFNI